MEISRQLSALTLPQGKWGIARWLGGKAILYCSMSQTSAATVVKVSTFSRLLMRVPVPWIFVLGYLAGVGLQHAIPPHPYFSIRTMHLFSVSGAILFGVGAVIAGWGLVLFHRARRPPRRARRRKRWSCEGPTVLPGIRCISD